MSVENCWMFFVFVHFQSPNSHFPLCFSRIYCSWFSKTVFFFGWVEKCRPGIPHWFRLHSMAVCRWSIDCWTAKNWMLICQIGSAGNCWMFFFLFLSILVLHLFFKNFIAHGFFQKLNPFFGWVDKCSMKQPHWFGLHCLAMCRWSIDCWTAKKWKLICKIGSVGNCWIFFCFLFSISQFSFSTLFFFFFREFVALCFFQKPFFFFGFNGLINVDGTDRIDAGFTLWLWRSKAYGRG